MRWNANSIRIELQRAEQFARIECDLTATIYDPVNYDRHISVSHPKYLFSIYFFRRTKAEVQFELGEKSRETILLDSKKIWERDSEEMRESIENCTQYASDIHKLKGAQREEVLLRLYAETAKLKAAAVWCVLIPFEYSSQVFSVFLSIND